MKTKLITCCICIGAVFFSGFCLKPTDIPVPEPSKVTSCDNWNFLTYTLRYENGTSRIDITVKDPNAGGHPTAAKSIFFNQKSKKIEYILAKLMNAYSTASSGDADGITFYYSGNEDNIIGLKFNNNFNNALFQNISVLMNIAFFTKDGIDYVNLVIKDASNVLTTYSFNIDDGENFDLDYTVGQCILIPFSTKSAAYNVVKITKLLNPFGFQFDWSTSGLPPQKGE